METNIFKNYYDKTSSFLSPLDENIQFQHCKSGIITEIAEIIDVYKKNIAYGKPLDKVNIIEEYGDVMFYIHHITSIMDDLNRNNILSNFDYYINCNEGVLSIIAPEYDKTISDVTAPLKYLTLLISMASSISFYQHKDRCAISGLLTLFIGLYVFMKSEVFSDTVTIESVLEKNFMKLNHRYNGKFNYNGANNRDLTKEREILETNV
jgi:NTP pyrophosphatase (non-canonical NTP hydrolase)